MHSLKNDLPYLVENNMVQTQDVLFEEMSGEGGDLGIIILNRPKSLNSLNHDMIHAIQPMLEKWAIAENIKAVVIRSVEGRAFCAGGDLRLTYERAINKNPAMTEFFYDEYQLNKTIHHFPKPYIALLDGITMGGGVGLSIHGSHRVATEHLLFAMPETGIGFFPDVGGTYFLPRLPGEIGMYLGLTGARIKADDCVAIGIANHKVPRDKIEDLVKALAATTFIGDAKNAVTSIIANFSDNIQGSDLLAAQQSIAACFSSDNIETMLEIMESSAQHLCQEAAKMMKMKSPTSLKVTLRALRQGKSMDFDTCMRQEYRLVARFLMGHDFIEGIRAVIIDKDQTPRWIPSILSEVDDITVKNYFSPLEKELV